jgi:ATP-dependent RNA helicase DOB1
LERRKIENDLHEDPELAQLYELYETKIRILQRIKDLKKQLTGAEAVLQMDELKCRRRVLRRLGYTSESDVIQVKGRVACEISAGDELLLTEMIFNGVFSDLNIEQTCALLSCFTFGERSSTDVELRPELKEPFRTLQDAARKIAEVSIECKIQMDPQEYVDSFRHELMPVVYAWALGAKFSQICKLTDVFEGSIIRAMRRLEELLRQLVAAAKSIGNTDLEEKFEKCKLALIRHYEY